MSLQDEIQDRLVADTESILESNLERVEKLFQFHGDGTIDLNSEYRDLHPKEKILIYFVAQRFALEGDISDVDTLSNEFFYERIDKDDSTIRHYLSDHRGDGLVEKEGQSEHRIIVENIPEALDRIEAAHHDSATEESA